MYLREGDGGDEARGRICSLGKRRICWCPWPSQIQICCCFLTPVSLGCLKCLFLLVCPLFFLVMYGFFFHCLPLLSSVDYADSHVKFMTLP